jgi:hypothetical protein
MTCAMRARGSLSIRNGFELLVLAGLAFHALHTGLGVGGDRVNSFVNDWLYVGLLAACAGGCLARALTTKRERTAWIALALSLVSTVLGDAYFTRLRPRRSIRAAVPGCVHDARASR